MVYQFTHITSYSKTMYILTTMDSLYTKLVLIKDANSTWTSKIIIDIPTPQPLFGVINSGSNKSSTVSLKVDNNTADIVALLNPPFIATNTVLENFLNYPKGVSFHFEGYKGVPDYETLKVYLVDKASSSDGAQLTVGISDPYTPKNVSHIHKF